MRFLVDMPLSPELAAWLVRIGHDDVHAGELGLHRAPDTTILERARMEQRVVVTADLDFHSRSDPRGGARLDTLPRRQL